MPEGEAIATTDCAKWVWDFEEPLPKAHTPAVFLGGKGAGLHELVRSGFPVPPGFTISTEACRAYFSADRAWPEGLWQQVLEAVRRLEERTGMEYGRGPRPLLVAVRSGASRSMPGMLDTILNCGLVTDLAGCLDAPQVWADHCRLIQALAAARWDVRLELEGDVRSDAERSDMLRRQYRERVGEPFPEDPWSMLRDAVAAVWHSWFSRRAVHYRRLRGWSDTPDTAVVVQAMAPVRSAGVLFTRDPRKPSIQKDAGTGPSPLIEAVAGRGDALVSGRFEPQRDVLTPSETEQLERLGRRLEKHFHMPLDVEWGITAEGPVVFQVRPMEEQSNADWTRQIRERERERIRRLTEAAKRVLVRHSLAETLPAPTPLTWDIVRRFMSGSGGFGRLYRRLGYRPGRRILRQGFLELVFGRIYADVERLPELFCEGLPLRYDLDRLRHDPGLLDQAPTEFDPRATDQRFLLRLPRMIGVHLRVSRRLRYLARTAVERYEAKVLPGYLEWVAGERKRRLESLSEGELLSLLEERRERVLDRFAPEAMLPGLLGGWELQELQRELSRLLGPEPARGFRDRLLQELEEPGDSLAGAVRRLVAGEIEPAEFLERFGHRGGGEMELANPRWREDPSPLLALARGGPKEAVEAGDGGPPSTKAAAQTSRLSSTSEDRLASPLRDALAAEGCSSWAEPLERRCERIRRLLPYRERGKDAWMRGYELLRDVLQELARRWKLDGDIYFLTLDELREHSPDRSRWRELAQARREAWQVLQRVALPEVIELTELDKLLELPGVDAGATSFRGVPLSAGTARGPAWRLDSGQVGPATGVDPPPTGYVLVCQSVDPGMTPWLLGACGLVVQRGGVLSHGALVARQMGIPAVACPEVADSIEAGTTLLVDGDRGLVQLEKAGA